MATSELSGVFELALSNDYMFTGAQTDDFIVRTTSNVQRILLGTQPGVAPLVTLSNNAVIVAGSLTATGYCNLLLNTVASTSTSNAPTTAALKQTYDFIVTLSNSVASSPVVTFSSNTAVYGSNMANTASNMIVALSNAVSSQASVVFASNVAAAALPAAGGVISGTLGVGAAPTGTTKLRVEGNIVSTGTITACNLQITGTLLSVNTTTSNASQMKITNMGNGPALVVTQTGAEPIADFYDDSNLALRIADGGFVGISKSNPQYTVDVGGDVNFAGTLYKNSQPFFTSRWSSNNTGSNIYKMDGRVAIGSNTHPELFSVQGGNAYFGSNITVGGTFSTQRLSSSGFYVRRDSNVATTTQITTAVQNIGFNSNNLQLTVPGACNAFQFMATSNLTPVLTVGANGTSTLYGDFNITGNLRRDGVILWGSNAQSNSVNTFQVLPVMAQFVVGVTTSNITNVFDVLGPGTYTTTPQAATVYLNGTKLVYVNSDLKDYDLSITNPNGYTTNYRITLTNTPSYNDILDVTIWPQTPNPASLTGIYCSNVDFTSNLTTGSVSISSNMTVGGNLVMRNGFFVTMDPSQGVQAATVVSAVAPNISSTAQGTTFYIPTQDSNSRFAVTASNNNSNVFIVRGDGKVAIQTPTLTNALTLGGNLSVGSSYASAAAPSNGLIVQGNLGVGLSNPTVPLHVLGDARIQGNLTVNGTQTIIDTNVATTERLDITNDGTGPTLKVTQLGAQPIADFYDDSNLAVRIADGGAVGVGTSAPSAILHISGPGTMRVQNSNVYAFPPSAMSSPVLNVTSGSAQGYYITTASAEFSTSNTAAWQAFNKDTTTQWGGQSGQYGASTPFAYAGSFKTLSTAGTAYSGDWLQIQLPAAVILSTYQIYYNTTFSQPGTFYILGAPDGLNWTLVDTQTQAQPGSAGYITFTPSSAPTAAYPFYRMVISNVTNGNGTVNVFEWIINGTLESMNITQHGKVGIGVRAPTQALEVAGNAIFYGNISAGNLGIFRNRIINGDMQIDQRNAGVAVANATGYVLDRFTNNKGGTFTQNVQQVAVPTPVLGYKKCMKVTVGTVQATLTASDYCLLFQRVEGYNVADFLFGTSYAQPCAFSFWIQTTNAATFSIYCTNQAFNRSYVTNFSVTTANVWQYVTVTIPGDTSGTWSTDNTRGLEIGLCFGTGTTYQTTANAWQASGSIGTSSTTNFFANAVGSAIYTTGWQLEKGTIATPFEFRPYAIELQLCQRYYQQFNYGSLALGTTGATGFVATKFSTTDAILINIPLACSMRATPATNLSTSSVRLILNTGQTTATYSGSYATPTGPAYITFVNNSVAAGFGWVDQLGTFTLSAEL